MDRRLSAGVLPCVNVPCLKEATSRLAILWFLGLASVVGTMMLTSSKAIAQSHPGQLITDPPRGLELDRAGTIQRFGLGDPALELSDAQKSQIDRAAATLAAESAEILLKSSVLQEPRRPDRPTLTTLDRAGMEALNQARIRFTDAVKNILNQDQKRTWESKRNGRQSPAGGNASVGARNPQSARPR